MLLCFWHNGLFSFFDDRLTKGFYSSDTVIATLNWDGNCLRFLFPSFSLLFCQFDILFFSSLLFLDIGQFCPSFRFFLSHFNRRLSLALSCIVIAAFHAHFWHFRLLNVVRFAIQNQWEAWVWGGETLLTEQRNQDYWIDDRINVRYSDHGHFISISSMITDVNKWFFVRQFTLRYRLPPLTLGPQIGTPLQSTRLPSLAMLVVIMRCWADLCSQFCRRTSASGMPITKYMESS